MHLRSVPANICVPRDLHEGCKLDRIKEPNFMVVNNTSPLNVTGEKIVILPLGDSLTKGAEELKCARDGAGCRGSTSYRYFLGLHLQETWGAYSFEFVGSKATQACQAFQVATGGSACALSGAASVCAPCTYPWDKGHEGHRAWTTRDVLDGKPGREPGLKDLLGKGTRPDIVLLLIGNNDIYKGFVKSTKQSVDNIKTIVDVLKVKSHLFNPPSRETLRSKGFRLSYPKLTCYMP